MIQAHQTRHTLLRRARDGGDERAWDELVQHYRRFIHHILKELGVAIDDAEDLSQQILVVLNRDLASYDRSRARFRTWFGTVIRNVAFEHFRKEKSTQKKLHRFGCEQALDGVGATPEVTGLIEREWSTYIANVAMENVRSLFKGQAIEVFELSLEGHSADEIAERSGLTVASVYTLRKRVKKRLYLEIRALSEDLEA